MWKPLYYLKILLNCTIHLLYTRPYLFKKERKHFTNTRTILTLPNFWNMGYYIHYKTIALIKISQLKSCMRCLFTHVFVVLLKSKYHKHAYKYYSFIRDLTKEKQLGINPWFEHICFCPMLVHACRFFLEHCFEIKLSHKPSFGPGYIIM